MKCDLQGCENEFDVPPLNVTIVDAAKGATWGYYCGANCAYLDAGTALKQMAEGKNLDEIENIVENEAPVVQAQKVAIVTQGLDNEPENDEEVPDVAEEAQPEVAAAPDPIQGIWNHVEENTAPEQVDGNPAIEVTTAPAAKADEQFVRDVANTLYQLFTGNIANFNTEVVEGDDTEDVMRVRLSQQTGFSFEIVITQEHMVQVVFPSAPELDAEFNPNEVDMGELGPFLLNEHVAKALNNYQANAQAQGQGTTPF